MKQRLWIAFDFLVVLAFAVWLVRPLFKAKYLDKWASIESTFISDARFLAEHWPNPKWQPLWYGGTRFDYVYPPALRYGTAVLVKYVPRMIPAKAYHIYTAFFYAMGIAGVYWLVWLGCGNRWAAYVAAVGTALLSPSFLFLKDIRHDAWLLVPQRLGVLVRYGEGPHMTALAVLGFALGFAFVALKSGNRAMLALAGIASALVVSNNFYGATALALFFPVMCWAVWVTHGDWWMWARAAAIAALAYGLTAFWFTPSYVKLTADNLKLVAEPGNSWSIWVAIAMAVVFVLLSDRFARGRRERTWQVFVFGAAAFCSLNVLGHQFFGFRAAGEPGRMIPELDLALILLAVEGLRILWEKKWMAGRIAVAAVLLVSFSFSTEYIRRHREIFPSGGAPEDRLEHKLSKWIYDRYPDARTMVGGSTRFWYNAWYSGAQVGGGSEQGLQNFKTIQGQWQMLMGDAPDLSIAWLQALGADLVMTHNKQSKEYYHDWGFPEKFVGKLETVYQQDGDYIFKVARKYPGIARVVDKKRLESLGAVVGADDFGHVRAYADVVEGGPDNAASTKWDGIEKLHVKARVGDGQAVVVQMTYDPNWKAYLNGTRVPAAKDVMGQIELLAPAGENEIEMRFETPLENTLGGLLSAITALVCGWLMIAGRR